MVTTIKLPEGISEKEAQEVLKFYRKKKIEIEEKATWWVAGSAGEEFKVKATSYGEAHSLLLDQWIERFGDVLKAAGIEHPIKKNLTFVLRPRKFNPEYDWDVKEMMERVVVEHKGVSSLSELRSEARRGKRLKKHVEEREIPEPVGETTEKEKVKA